MSAADANVSTVCLLDDDIAFLQAIERLLSSTGVSTEHFTDPSSFLSYAQTHHPRVAVIDIYMPAMSGLEVQTRLHTASPSTQVIVLTAKDDPSVRTKAMAGGASGFFLKAGSEKEFVARVESLLSPS